MHRRVIARHNGKVRTALQQRTHIIQRHAPIELHERPIDYLLEITRGKHPGIGQRQEVPPRFRRETPALVRSHYAKGHQLSQVLYAARRQTWRRASAVYHRIRAASTLSTNDGVKRPGIMPGASPNDRWAVNLSSQTRPSEAGDFLCKCLYIKGFRVNDVLGCGVQGLSLCQQATERTDRIAGAQQRSSHGV